MPFHKLGYDIHNEEDFWAELVVCKNKISKYIWRMIGEILKWWENQFSYEINIRKRIYSWYGNFMISHLRNGKIN